jgi:hypothetical protein
VIALGLVALAAAGAVAETVAESLAELVVSSQQYQESLARLLVLEEEEAARAAVLAERYRTLERGGLVSRREVEVAEQAAAQARGRVEETRGRIAEAGRAVVEAEGLLRLALVPPPPPGEERATPEVVEYHGPGSWALHQVASLERFFAQRFGRPLPISALGQTATHDRLGFDHSNAVDVAVHPDSVEGRALLEHLRGRGMPFLAFRGAIAGVSTGAHVHVGARSPRKS